MMISMKFHHSYRVLWSKQKKTGQLESVGNDKYQSFSRQGLTESLSDTLDQAIESP